MFHAVSLEPGVEMAKVLAFSAAGLRAGVERLEKAAGIDGDDRTGAKLGEGDEEPERLAMYRFGVETMEEHTSECSPRRTWVEWRRRRGETWWLLMVCRV